MSSIATQATKCPGVPWSGHSEARRELRRDGVISHDGQIEDQTEKKNCGTMAGGSACWG